MGVVAINFVEFGSLLLRDTKNFKKIQKMMKRFLRGSSSQSSKDKQAKENKKPKYNLPRVMEVRPCEWPCDEFLRTTGICDDFYSLADNAGLTDFLHDQLDQYLLLTNTFVQIFTFMLRNPHLRWSFIYMMRLGRCHYMIFVGFARYPSMAA